MTLFPVNINTASMGHKLQGMSKDIIMLTSWPKSKTVHASGTGNMLNYQKSEHCMDCIYSNPLACINHLTQQINHDKDKTRKHRFLLKHKQALQGQQSQQKI
jgi:hypothetical protein